MKSKPKKIILNDNQAKFLQWLYEKHFAYGGVWFQWWKSEGEKSWEKYLNAYYKKFDASK